MKESLDFKLDKIELRLRESIPNSILGGCLLVCYTLICIFMDALSSFITLVFIVILLIYMHKMAKKKERRLFNKHYEVKIKRK